MDKSTIRDCVKGYIRGDMFPDDEQAADELIASLEASDALETLVEQAIDSIGSVQEKHPSATYETVVEVGMEQWRKELPEHIKSMAQSPVAAV